VKTTFKSRGRRYALLALSTVGAGTALLALGGANPFLDLQQGKKCPQQAVALAPVTGVGVLGLGSGQGNIQAAGLAHQVQLNRTSAPAKNFCKDVN
jgi:hypothetical protein